jgi:hypothetical protein
MCQVLSWAFARSAGARSWEWARLAAFGKAGLLRPPYGMIPGSPAPMYPFSASTINPGAARRRTMPPDPGCGQVVEGLGHPQDVSVRAGDDLQVHPVLAVLAGVDRPPPSRWG